MERRVLLVEDEEMIRHTLVRICQWLGLEATVAADGREGLELLESSSFALVITDLRMPGVDGLEIARAARRQGEPPAVIVISGFVTSDDEASIVCEGAKLLHKPFGASEAREMIGQVLGAG